MASPVPRRERPVDPSNRYPRGPAYACIREKDHKFAEDHYHRAYQQQSHGQDGPYAKSTIALFNNWITALIKLYRYDEAEAHCQSMLHSLEAAGMQDSSRFICVQCNLAASLFLSGHLPAAEELFDTIRARQALVSAGVAREFFEVLSLVRLTKNDCLVFRESCANFAGLMPVNDYTTLRDGKHDKKQFWRSSIGSLRRVTSLAQGLGQVGAKGDADKLDGPRALLKRVLRLDRGHSRLAAPEIRSISVSSLPVPEPDRFSPRSPSEAFGQQHTRTFSPSQWHFASLPLQPALITGEANYLSQPDLGGSSGPGDEVDHEAAVPIVPWPLSHNPIQSALLTGESSYQSQPGYTVDSDSSDDIEFDPATDLAFAWGSVSSSRLSVEHTLQPPSTLRNSFDARLGLTHRSQLTTTSSQDADFQELTLLTVTAWAENLPVRIEMQLDAFLDGGCCKNLASLAFARTINAQLVAAEDVQLVNPDGSALHHLGRINVGISFKGRAGTRVENIRCLVVENLKTALLIGSYAIQKYDLEEASRLGASKLAIFGPILMNPRTKKEKRDNESHSNAVAAARKEDEKRLAAARKAERAMTAASPPPAANSAPASPKASPIVRVDSPLGGSDTTAASPRSSMTFPHRSNTTSTAASSPSLRTTSSDSHRPGGFSTNSAHTTLPTTSDASHAL